MKNILAYFYHFVVTNDINSSGYFFYNNQLFCLKKYKRSREEVNSLLILNNYMLINNQKINRIILNINNEVLSLYDNDYYVLLKIDYQKYNNYFKMIVAPSIKELNNLRRDNWAYLWSVKIDYIEYQIEHLMNKYPLIYDTVNYYIGLTENAITYFKMLNLTKESLYVAHRRMMKNNYYNPLDLIIDYQVRDIVEYLKYQFFDRQMSSKDVINYLKKTNFTEVEYLLLYVRFLYPSYYFDVYEKIINKEQEEKTILDIINIANEYEDLLKQIIVFIKTKVKILEITWLN